VLLSKRTPTGKESARNRAVLSPPPEYVIMSCITYTFFPWDGAPTLAREWHMTEPQAGAALQRQAQPKRRRGYQ
jgi:hypothetical protein